MTKLSLGSGRTKQAVNKLQDEVQLLAECRAACDRLIERSSAGQDSQIGITTLEKVQETTAVLAAELAGTTSSDRPVRHRRKILGWSLLYAATVSGILWWYEIRPSQRAHRQLQGAWQYTEGMGHEERLKEVYFQVVGSDTWLTYPLRSKWIASRSWISIRPANDFFIVRREFGRDYGGNTRESEYIIRLANDRLYFVRGMATLDSMQERKIEKLRSIEQLPPAAARIIETSQ